MQIRDSVYQLCKSVRASQPRDQVRSLIDSINKKPLGYVARHLRAQILGYLVADRDRAQFAQAPWHECLDPLLADEKEVLEQIHRQFTQLNARCAEKLVSCLPQCREAIDPYGMFRYEMKRYADRLNIFSEEDVDLVVTNFWNHPSIEVAVACTQAISGLQHNAYAQAVLKLRDKLLNVGPLRTPQDLANIAVVDNVDTPRRVLTRGLLALMCFRSSLSVLNQLVFQSLLHDHLCVLDEDNIIKIRRDVQHFSGKGVSIVFQPDEICNALGIEELILVKGGSCAPPLELLGQVERVRSDSAFEFGMTEEVCLREIDENLNPFGPLLRDL